VRFVIFTHSLISDWNHSSAHFLRGYATELAERGHEVKIFEPRGNWSLRNLMAGHGLAPVVEFRRAYPSICSRYYNEDAFDAERALHGANVVLVHEWNSHQLVRRIGEHRAGHPTYRLFFHDTHHRSVTDPAAMAAYDLRHYDGVLACGSAICDFYREKGQAAWTWHEAADTRIFHPRPGAQKQGDVVWIGNWGDDERTDELREFFIGPVKTLGLKTRVYGVRYPQPVLNELAEAGIEYGDWAPNYRVPEIFAQYHATVHLPRRPYVRALAGIPAIRMFEALACGIPLVSAPWEDREGLFRPGHDFLCARDGAEMVSHLRAVLADSELAESLAASGLEAIRARHTCRHRVDELLEIVSGAGRWQLAGS
jgi:spore maturation protein CgeB